MRTNLPGLMAKDGGADIGQAVECARVGELLDAYAAGQTAHDLQLTLQAVRDL